MIAEHQRIAAAENNLRDRDVVSDHLKSRLPVIKPPRLFLIRVVAAKAVSAMHRTGTGGNQENATVVLLCNHAICATGIQIADGIRNVIPATYRSFSGEWQDLTKQGVVTSPGGIRLQKILRYQNRESSQKSAFRSEIPQVVGNLFRAGDPEA